MSDHRHRIAIDWHRCLLEILARARTVAGRGLVIFDLDSTVFDNRPRQARIIREFGVARGLEPLARCQSFQITDGWDLKGTAVACGLPVAEVDKIHKDLKRFWGSKFFTSEYCQDDVEVVGAPRYVHECLKTGAQVAYVTGRYEQMRAGTLLAMERCGVPMPSERVTLVMKPRIRESDDDFKREIHASLEARGQVLAAFDNEPVHANDYAKRFPDATVVHLATDDSSRPVPLDPRIISIPHFAY